jgi:hypothetical protein
MWYVVYGEKGCVIRTTIGTFYFEVRNIMRDDAVQAQILSTRHAFFPSSWTFQSTRLTKVFASAFVMLIMVGGRYAGCRYNIDWSSLPSLPFS